MGGVATRDAVLWCEDGCREAISQQQDQGIVQVEVTQILVLVETLLHAWNDVPLEWVQVVRGRPPRAEQWPRQSSSEWQSEGSSTTKIPKSSVTVVRERRTPEQVRLQSTLDTVADGCGGRVALQMALVKAQKHAEELPLARQIQVTKYQVGSGCTRKYDICELPLAEALLERLQKEVAMSRPATPGPASTAPDLEAGSVGRDETPIRPPQSSTLSADLLRVRAFYCLQHGG